MSLHTAYHCLIPVTNHSQRYFRGILFLTTNRVRVFDEAFQSRIHVSLRYADLSSDAKRSIWLAFLRRVNGNVPNGGISHDELHALGEKKVNGRQIKNIVKTAGALAQGRQEKLSFAHLEQVLDLMEQFDTAYAAFFFLLLCLGVLTGHLQAYHVSIEVSFRTLYRKNCTLLVFWNQDV